jgi:hypothetical protein
MITNLFQESIPHHFLLFSKSPVDGEKCEKCVLNES